MLISPTTGLGFKESEEALRSFGYRHIMGAVDTDYDYGIWQKRDIVLIRDNRTGKVLTTVALDSYGKRSR